MANEEHLKILRQGVKVWNRWRLDHASIAPDLEEADLAGLTLRAVDFRGVHLGGAILRNADLQDANLSPLEFSDPNVGTYIIYTTGLTEANLSDCILLRANLSHSLLMDTKLCRAYMEKAILTGAEFWNTDVTDAVMDGTVFSNSDLRKVVGLGTFRHRGPSTIGIDTIYKSKGQIPEAFLRGCGLSDWEIVQTKLYNPDLDNDEITKILYRVHELRAQQPIQIKPLFISYSHRDTTFVDKIGETLRTIGIRYWRDKEHATSGRLEKQIDRAISLNDIVLLVLSEHSVESDWVEHEARKAREKEKKSGIDALCPVALDDSWKTCRWPERLREQIMEYNILDFSRWQDADQFERMFTRLIDGLAIFYK